MSDEQSEILRLHNKLRVAEAEVAKLESDKDLAHELGVMDKFMGYPPTPMQLFNFVAEFDALQTEVARLRGYLIELRSEAAEGRGTHMSLCGTVNAITNRALEMSIPDLAENHSSPLQFKPIDVVGSYQLEIKGLKDDVERLESLLRDSIEVRREALRWAFRQFMELNFPNREDAFIERGLKELE